MNLSVDWVFYLQLEVTVGVLLADSILAVEAAAVNVYLTLFIFAYVSVEFKLELLFCVLMDFLKYWNKWINCRTAGEGWVNF